jgi:uncharacterized alkaline shock family protein YloU
MELEISKSVLYDIAESSVGRIEGAELAASLPRPSEVLKSGTPRRPKALKLSREGRTVTAEIGLNVEFGRNLTGVAAQVQRSVTENIELMTGLQVAAVSVTVVGVTLPRATPPRSEAAGVSGTVR